MMDTQSLTHKKLDGLHHTTHGRWTFWLPTVTAIVSIAVAAFSLAVAMETRITVNELESRVIIMENMLGEDALFYQDEQAILKSRSKRSLKERQDGVRVYDGEYLGNFNRNDKKNRLTLYGSLNEKNIVNSVETLRPHHKISPLWSDEQMNNVMSSAKEIEDTSIGTRKFASSLVKSADRKRLNLLNRRSRVKSHHARNAGRRRKQRLRTNSNVTESIMFRPSHVKNTNRIQPSPQPPPPVPAPSSLYARNKTIVVDQSPKVIYAPYSAVSSNSEKKKKKSNKSNRRLTRSRRHSITLAHYHLMNQSNSALSDDLSWVPASWMEGLGLNRKYHMTSAGEVVVKEAGLYHVYAQLVYEGGLSVENFNVFQDNIPFLHCKVPAPVATLGARVHSCHTSATTYLPKNAIIRVENLPGHNAGTVMDNSFFGLIKLMAAPDSAEELLLA